MATLVQLEYAVAVERLGHFAKAAKTCNISQPTLSQQIQKLEDELGIHIFDRMRKPVTLTEEGRRFIEQAKVVLLEQQKLLDLARQRREGLHGVFRLGIIPTVASFLLPLFVETFARRHPSVKLYIEEMKTTDILDALRRSQIDGAILATPLREPMLEEHPLYYEPLHLYACPEHPLLELSEVRAEDLDASELWTLLDGHCFRDQVAQFCSIPPKDASVFRNIHFQSGSLETLRNLVRQSRGYTLIPALMLATLSEEERLACVRSFRSPMPAREVSFMYHREQWKSDLIAAIEAAVKCNLPDSVRPARDPDLQVLEVCETRRLS